MKILLLNQTFYPDVVATAQYLSELAETLAERGHEVTVVTGRYSYEKGDKTFPAFEIWHGIKIFRVYTTRMGKKAKWRRVVDFSSFIFFCCLRLMIVPKQDVVVGLTTPPLISFIGACRARFRAEKFFYWVMDFNPDEAIAAGWIRADSAGAKLLEWMSRFSLRHSHRIIALDRFMRDRIVDKGVSSGKIAIIPPWSHDGAVHFDAPGREHFRKAYNLTGKFVVMYAGNHSAVNPLDTLLGAAEILRNDAEILFCFVGGGSEFKRVSLWAKEGGCANVLCLPYQPLNILGAMLSAADAHVVVLGNKFVGLIHPCKVYNILAVSSPVIYIGPRPSHVTEILDDLEKGYPSVQVQHGNPSDLARQILALRQKWPADRPEIKKGDVDAYSKKILLENLTALIEGEIIKA